MTMCAVILGFGLIIALLATYLIKNNVKDSAVLRVFGVILILILTVFLVVAGYNDVQIAPALGLLGTIAGYLLGKGDPNKEQTGEGDKTRHTDTDG
ncbi:hypothetical protein CA603_32900 [Paraburkholderia hospita]|nr:hypothetical protein CA603_32900 [Paraburkholderia hospita]